MEGQSFVVRMKNIKLQNIVKNYMEGKFSNVDEKNLIPIRKSDIGGIIGKKHGISSKDDSYKYVDKNNNQITVQTSNHKNFQLFNESGGSIRKGGMCDYCKCKFQSFCIGFPVSFYEKTLINEDKTYVFYIFNIKGEFCNFECVRAHLEMIGNSQSLGIHLQGLLFLYKLIHGNRILKAANDKYLLQENGGTLSRNEWLSLDSVYIPTHKIICAPIKTEFIVKNIEFCKSYQK